MPEVEGDPRRALPWQPFLWSAFDGPGRFWSSFGPPGVIALFLVHILYGMIVGGVYKTQHNYVPNFGAGS